eukprot:CAMPEP_0194275008 /NCGR_PEP_ID=MMETSP0169-20130528/7945_1 /TAXON_ID=218684 /ORGANISM="Corethron pennatum, Strain L29A3" /LENGTH=538 /DNA_ID=CAMNT_0039018357 /DNA_START=22 /DNA_END=1634 /DNA_ORIENTATION=-
MLSRPPSAAAAALSRLCILPLRDTTHRHVRALHKICVPPTRKPLITPSDVRRRHPRPPGSRLLSSPPPSHPPRDDENGSVIPVWYTCGPTVYGPAHLGHARTYVSLDMVRRTSGGRVAAHVTNVTDVDDKIIAAAAASGERPLDLAARFEAEFWADMARLHVLRPDAIVRVSEYMEEIVAYVAALEAGGLAYAVPGAPGDGSSVYFDVTAFEGSAAPGGRGLNQYGRLAPGVEAVAPSKFFEWEGGGDGDGDGGSAGSVQKRDPRDFALWKGRPAPPGLDHADLPHGSILDTPGSELCWTSPFGPGRPGWHVECSAMLDAAVDVLNDGGSGGRYKAVVHCGGIDLKFPHHANEVAQSLGYRTVTTGAAPEEEWIDRWVHTGHLHISGRKMSKSLKNFVTVEEMFDVGHGGDDSDVADDFRLWCLGLSGSHTGPATYSPSRLREAAEVRGRIVRFLVAAQRHCDTAGEERWDAEDATVYRTANDSGRACDAALAGGGDATGFDGVAAYRHLMEMVAAGEGRLAVPAAAAGPVRALAQRV